MKRNSTPRVHFILFTAIIMFLANFTQHSFAQCTVVPGNLVLNPSFENGTANWTSSGGNFSAGGGAVVCGAYSGDFEITNPASNWVSQTIATDLPAGTVLNASVYAGTHDNSYWHEVSIQFFDANWNWISSAWVDMDKSFYSVPNGPRKYNWTAIVPAGAKYTTAQFSGDGNWIKTDNWVVTLATPGTVALGNNVYIDRNGNGKKDAIDWGYDGLTVTLYADNDDNGVADGGAVATTTTYGDGQYYFTNLAPGKYFVQLESVPSWLFKCSNNGGDPDNDIDNDNNGVFQNTGAGIIKGETISLSAGGEPGNTSSNNTYDFGFFKTNGLGDYVFLDANANGVQDAGENGISGVTVNLRNTSGTLLESTTTDANGYYAFYDPAQYGTYNYNIEFVTPAGYLASPSNQGSNDDKDSDPVAGVISNVSVPGGTWNYSFDAGFVPQPCDARVTNLFFNRLDGGTDLPISNGAVFSIAQLGSLYNLEAGTSGTIGSVMYTITGPTPSSNIENVFPYNSPATGSGAWTGAAGVYTINVKAYSLGNATGPACHDTTFTFTLITDFASISNFVWHDINKNGLQDSGEPGLSGKEVILKKDGSVVASQNTNTNGEYYFGNLVPGTYTLEFTSIGGMQRALHGVGTNPNINSKANNVTGLATVTIAAGENNNTMDAGYQTASLLPVQDIVLAPKVNGNVVEVNWQTINEMNTSYFEVERSYNNTSFEKVQTVYSLVQNGENGSYRIVDNGVQMSAATVVYRIKIVDRDGRTGYSRIASLRLGKVSDIVFGPNPFTDYLTINYPATANSMVSLAILDMTGKKLLTKEFTVSRGTSSLTVNNLGSLAKGTYVVQLTEAGSTNRISFKLIK
jgi:SdrD B-like domain/Secretion system C-terminal sorting domain